MALPDRIVHREAGQAAGVAETSCSKTGLDSDRRLLSGSDLQSGERITGSAVGGERVGQWKRSGRSDQQATRSLARCYLKHRLSVWCSRWGSVCFARRFGAWGQAAMTSVGRKHKGAPWPTQRDSTNHRLLWIKYMLF